MTSLPVRPRRAGAPSLAASLFRLGIALLGLSLSGCVAPFTGVGSLAVLAPPGAPLQAVPIGPAVKVEQCQRQILGFMFSQPVPSHETVVTEALIQTGADLLLDAKLSTSRTTVLSFYARLCAVVEGVPARIEGVR